MTETKTKPRIKGTVHLTAKPLTINRPSVGDLKIVKPTPPVVTNGDDPLGR